MCVCVCVCVCVYVVLSTHNCIMTYDRYYKEKVIYEDIFSVPIIQNAYKSYRDAQSPVRAKFRCRAITHTV